METHYKHTHSEERIKDFLVGCIDDNTAIVCIGTDKCIVDSLGPLVGTLLKEKGVPIDVYGTLNDPVHALNVAGIGSTISKKYSTVIAIDACLSNKRDIGTIECREGHINPGKGIGKDLPNIGDFSIFGIIDKDRAFTDLVQDCRLSLAYNMANVIAGGISLAVKESEFNREAALANSPD